MGHPALPLTGACLCGVVQIEVTKPALLTVACHCRDCQKFTASAYSLTTMFPREGFFYSGELIRGGLGSAERTHHFCASCLNFIFSEVKGAEHRVNVRTSLLDEVGAFPPFAEIMVAEKLPWATTAAAHSFDTYPASLEELQALMTAYMESFDDNTQS